MSARAYLDWAASAPLLEAARETMVRALERSGNPSSVHLEGRGARALLEDARAQVARLAGCSPRELIFVGSGTEANATAVLGHASAGRARGRSSLLLGATEHPSVLLAGAAAARQGCLVRELPVDEHGRLVVDDPGLADRPDDPLALIAVQAANNETGVIQPVAGLCARARELGARVHCDAVQAAGKLDLSELTARCDTLAISAHKLGGPHGIGALVVRAGLELDALVPGHQERGRRGGTPPLFLVAGFGAAAAAAFAEREARVASLRVREARLRALLRAAAPDVRFPSEAVERVPGIVSATFPGADGETLLVALDLAGVAASHGAACATGALEPSHVLLAMGRTERDARATIRFSVGPTTTDAELDLLARVLPKALRAGRDAGVS